MIVAGLVALSLSSSILASPILASSILASPILASPNLASPMLVPAADGPPRFDIEKSCRNAGEPTKGVGRPNQSCREDEGKAEAALQQHWSDYPPASRGTCVEGASLAGPPSYVQVLTCLEMAAPK